jgi:signal transduction histidine kinase
MTTIQQFIADAAHELRTPLTALRTNLDLALEKENAADRAFFLVRAQAMVGRLKDLVRNAEAVDACAEFILWSVTINHVC